MNKFRIFLCISMIAGFTILTFGQLNADLPANLRNQLEQNFPKWKLVKNVCQTSTLGDFNNDTQIDYVAAITFQNGGRIVVAISEGFDFRLIILKSLTKSEAQIETVSTIEKGETVKLFDDAAPNNPVANILKNDNVSIGLCQSTEKTHIYSFENDTFTGFRTSSENNTKEFNGSENNSFGKTEFIVKGPKPWLDTGIDVDSGCIVKLFSEGRVDVSSGWGSHDANGTTQFYPNYNYPVNSTFRYGLAAQITSSKTNSRDRKRDSWVYGGENVHIAKQTGRLWLVVNDDNPADNKGEFRVRVEIICD